jgi:hypothetical protein
VVSDISVCFFMDNDMLQSIRFNKTSRMPEGRQISPPPKRY